MSITQQDIDNLDAAIVSGELTVNYQGRTLTYQSTDSMIKARAHAARVLRQNQAPAAVATMGGKRISLASFAE